MNLSNRDEWGFDELHEAVDVLQAAHHRTVAQAKELREQVYHRGLEIKQLREEVQRFREGIKAYLDLEIETTDLAGMLE